MGTRPFADRFWEKVHKSEGCWQWTGACRSDGYGAINSGIRPSKVVATHRASWKLHFGEIPDGLWVLHKCDNRKCVNPEHLFLGNRLDNILDMVAKGRARPYGGPMPGEAHPNAKLTDEAVREIRAEYTGVHGQVAAMARKYEISRRVLLGVAKRQIWKHVE